jgi:hypothetical protein
MLAAGMFFMVSAPQQSGANAAEAAATPQMRADKATRHDHTALSAQELQRLLPPSKRVGTEYVIPNQLGTARSAPRSELDVDPLAGSDITPNMPTAGVDFLGPTSDDNQAVIGGRIEPPDTNCDVGAENVVCYINLVWRVVDKAGNPVGGAMEGNTFWAGFGGVCETNNDGDPIVLYDHIAGRWVYNQFAPFNGVQCFAISDGEDPTTGFTRYEFVVEPAAFNDYPKVGMWINESGSQSSYTYTGRNFTPQGNPFLGRDISAVLFDRDAMLANDPTAGFITMNNVPGGFNTWDGLQPGHIDNLGTAPGDACPLFSVAEGSSNRYRFYEFCGDFDNPGNSTFGELPAVAVPPFDDGLGNVPLPGGDSVDTLAFFTMYRASHRNLGGNGGHQLALAHTVDAGGDRAGMRWAIMDVDNYAAISVIDTGTHAPNDGLERWMGSVTLDEVGNLGLGYTRGGNGQFAGVAVTGREVGDPAGQVQNEVVCEDGSGSQTGGGNRWGDYSSTSIDPVDGCTFWTAQEYVRQTGSFEWDTRVCSFSFGSCTGVTPMDYTLLATDPGIAGQVNDWPTINGTPNGGALLYLGGAAGSTNVNVGPCSTTLGIANARAIQFQSNDGNGAATFSRSVPPGLAGRTILFQALDLQGCDTSNVTTTTFQ